MFWWMNTGLRLASISGINTTCSLKFEDIWDVKLHHFPEGTMVQWQQKIEFLTQPFLIPLFICEDIPLCVVHYQSRCGSLMVIREGYDSWVLSSVYIHQDTSILSREKSTFNVLVESQLHMNHYTVQSAVQTHCFLSAVLTGSDSYKHMLALNMHTVGLQIITDLYSTAYRNMSKQVLKVKDTVSYNMKTYQLFQAQ